MEIAVGVLLFVGIALIIFDAKMDKDKK